MATTEGGDDSASPEGAAATFADFLRRVCAGDELAATELVQRYEPALRLEVQLRFTDPKLRRLLDPAEERCRHGNRLAAPHAVGDRRPDEHPLLKAALEVLSDPRVVADLGIGFEVMRDTVNSFAPEILAVQRDGSIIAAGTTTGPSGTTDIAVVRFTSTGALDPTFAA